MMNPVRLHGLTAPRLSRDKVQIYYGQHIAAGPVGDPEWLEAERVGGTWRIANAIYPAQTTSERR